MLTHISKMIASIFTGIQAHTEGDILFDANLRIEEQSGQKPSWIIYLEKKDVCLTCTVPPQEYYFIWVLAYARRSDITSMMKRGDLLDEIKIEDMPARIRDTLAQANSFAWNSGYDSANIAAQQSKMKSVINGKLHPSVIILENGYYRLNPKIKAKNILIPDLQ